jgi:putative holliday junction resolvase
VAVALGLDVGERRIGVAKGDPTGLLAAPLTTVIRTSDKEAVDAIAALAVEHGAEWLVVGVPLDAEGQHSEQSRRIQAFGRKLRAVPGTRVVFWDERFTTETAEESLRASGPRRRGAPTARQREADRRRLDAAAAAVILQDYLDHARGQVPSASPEQGPN